MHLRTKTKRNLKTHIKYNVLAMTSLKTHVKYNVIAMTNLKTHVKHNVFAMTNLKTHAPGNKKQAKEHGKQQNVLKPMRLCTKTKQKGARNGTHATRILAPGRPSDKDNGLHAPTQLRLARTHGTHDTHETKTKTKRSRSPGYGGSDKPD